MMENSCEEPCVALQKVQEAVAELLFCHVSELESILKYIVPTLLQTMQQIYARNDLIVKSNEGDVLSSIRDNFQVALNLMDSSNDILEHIVKTGVVGFSCIPSLPVNLAHVLFYTFDHCKNSQKTYSSYYKSVSEILDLFRKTQELHSRYLIFLDTLTLDFFNEDETMAYKEILDIVLKISSTLTGVNMKSMVDNWKGFISLIQKSSEQNVPLNISAALRILTEEIHDNLSATFETTPGNSKKCIQDLKVTGFLVKVALKLLEIDFTASEEFQDVLKFWIMIYSMQSRFVQINKLLDEVISDSVNGIFHLCSESMPNLLCSNSNFLKHFLSVFKDPERVEQPFGFLTFIIAVIKELPKLLAVESKLPEYFDGISLLQVVFNLLKSCYMEYFCDHNSIFYEDFVTAVAVIVLHCPNEFLEVEKMLLRCIVDDENIWVALIAIDIWCLVLKYSTECVCRSTLTTLIKKIGDLKLGIFHETPATVRLKLFTQRIFKILPASAASEEISKYNTSHLHSWKILNFRNIPLSHRYYVEFLMCDIYEKMEMIEKDFSVSDLVHLMENLDIISYTKFNNLEINAVRLSENVVQLWSFDMTSGFPVNEFLHYFIYKLLKITTALILELSNQKVLFVFTQLKSLVHHAVYKLLICDMLQIISRRNFNNSLEKHSLFIVIIGLFQMLLADKSSIVVQLAMESFLRLSNSHNYDIVINQVLNGPSEIKKRITEFTQKKASEGIYEPKFFEKSYRFKYRHVCCDWTIGHQPVCKKIKIDNDTDVLITDLKTNAEKIINKNLTANQRIEIKSVINSLGQLLK